MLHRRADIPKPRLSQPHVPLRGARSHDRRLPIIRTTLGALSAPGPRGRSTATYATTQPTSIEIGPRQRQVKICATTRMSRFQRHQVFKKHQRASSILYALPLHASLYIRMHSECFPPQSSSSFPHVYVHCFLFAPGARLPLLRPCSIVCVIRLTKVPV